MTTTTAPAAPTMAIGFYRRARPVAERLLTLAREWRDAAPTDLEAIQAHSLTFWLVVRVDLELCRLRAPAEPGAPIPPGG